MIQMNDLPTKYPQWSFADALKILAAAVKPSRSLHSPSNHETTSNLREEAVDRLLSMIRATIPPLMWREETGAELESFLREQIQQVVCTARSFGVSQAESKELFGDNYSSLHANNNSSLPAEAESVDEQSIRLRVKWLIAASALGLDPDSLSDQSNPTWSGPCLASQSMTREKRPVVPRLGTLQAAQEVIESLGPRDLDGQPMCERVEIKVLNEPVAMAKIKGLTQLQIFAEGENVYECMLGPYGNSTAVQPVLGGKLESSGTALLVRCRLRALKKNELDYKALNNGEQKLRKKNRINRWLQFRDELKGHWADRLFPAWLQVHWEFTVPWDDAAILDAKTEFHLNESFTLESTT